MNILFRCDASVEIGSGHIMRCLTLARKMKERGWQSCFFVSKESLVFVEGKGFPVHQADKADELSGLKAICESKSIDLIILDHYQLDITYEKRLRRNISRIAIIDDLADREHDCDVIIDQTSGRSQADYQDLVPHNCKIITGTHYAIIAPAYQQLRESALEKRRQTNHVKRVLVSLGGTNLNNCTGFALGAIRGYKEKPLIVDVVLGGQAYKLKVINQQIDRINKETEHCITFHVGTKKMHELMFKADIAVGAGGTTSWERSCLGLPTIMIEIADNQRFISKSLHGLGAVHNLGKIQDIKMRDLTKALIKYTTSPKDTVIMSEKSSALCDGRGSDRILPYLIPETPLNSGKLLSLRFMAIDDADAVYEWQSHPGLRQYSRNTDIPTKEEHLEWMTSSLKNTLRYPYIVLEDKTPVGIIRLDKLEHTENRYEISILTAPIAAHKGIASAAHGLLRKLHPNVEIIAEVNSENIASLKLFKKMHYLAVSDNQYLLKPSN